MKLFTFLCLVATATSLAINERQFPPPPPPSGITGTKPPPTGPSSSPQTGASQPPPTGPSKPPPTGASPPAPTGGSKPPPTGPSPSPPTGGPQPPPTGPSPPPPTGGSKPPPTGPSPPPPTGGSKPPPTGPSPSPPTGGPQPPPTGPSPPPPTGGSKPPPTGPSPQPPTGASKPPPTGPSPPPPGPSPPPPTNASKPPPTGPSPPPPTGAPSTTINAGSVTTQKSGVTTVLPSTYTAYQQYLINKAKALVAAGTCASSMTSGCSGNCTTKASSLYYSWTDTSYRYILLSGIPGHTFGSGAVKPNPNAACENIAYFKLPLNPVKGTTTSSSPMGPVGASVTGAYFYNTLSNPDGSLAVVNEGASLDSCAGHSDPSCRYHYHSEPTCVTNYNGGCILLGYWYDGFPIYSYCPSPMASSRMMTSCYSKNSGATGLKNTDYSYSKTSSCDLDQNNGYTDATGSYKYYMTSTYPWLPVGYSGSVAGRVCAV